MTSDVNYEQFKIPTLHLLNVEIRNILNDYQSLIYLEKDNFVIQELSVNDDTERVIKHYGNYVHDANITIK